jgi:hypothetical protein
VRRWIVERLKLDNEMMTDLGEGDPVLGRQKVFAAGAAGLPGMPDTSPPFIVVRALPFLPALSPSRVQTMPYLIWVHDQQGSFEAIIGPVLSRLRAVLPTDLPIKTVDGAVIMNCVWEADSADLFDQGFETATRYGQYRLTVRPA